MSSYFSSLLTTTTSRYASIKQTLLSSEADGDTEDDTNVCRILRSYYTEKGRPFPGWLPPDPKAPPPIVIAPVYSTPNVGAGYGGLQAPDSNKPASSRLNSLWDAGRGGQDNQSLRSNGGRPVAAARSQGVRSPFDRTQTSSEPPPPMARPLPSQRAGSYQTAGRDATPPTSSSGGSAQDRLKARFGQKSGQSTPRQADTSRQTSSNSYGSANSGGGGNYEDSFAPGNYNSNAGSRGGDRPFVAATSPWASNEREFSGGGGAPAPARMGLPSGPGGRRGLPGGPRSNR